MRKETELPKLIEEKKRETGTVSKELKTVNKRKSEKNKESQQKKKQIEEIGHPNRHPNQLYLLLTLHALIPETQNAHIQNENNGNANNRDMVSHDCAAE